MHDAIERRKKGMAFHRGKKRNFLSLFTMKLILAFFSFSHSRAGSDGVGSMAECNYEYLIQREKFRQ
jgi:hypothetical protein